MICYERSWRKAHSLYFLHPRRTNTLPINLNKAEWTIAVDVVVNFIPIVIATDNVRNALPSDIYLTDWTHTLPKWVHIHIRRTVIAVSHWIWRLTCWYAHANPIESRWGLTRRAIASSASIRGKTRIDAYTESIGSHYLAKGALIAISIQVRRRRTIGTDTNSIVIW